jgi:hypothetical protein
MIKGIRNNIAARLSPTRAHWSGLRADFTERLRLFRLDRDTDLPKLMEQDFMLVLEAWGIAREEDIPFVLRDLRLRRLLLVLPLAVVSVFALLAPGIHFYLTLLLIASPCLFGLLTTRWRMSVLQNRAYTPLLRWLTARFIKERST